MKKRDALLIGSACLILGILIAVQYRFIQKSYLTDSGQAQKSAELINELNATKEKHKQLLQEISDLQKQLDDIKNAASSESVLVKNLTDELQRYKAYAGMTKLSGSGVMVTIDNPHTDMNNASEKNIAYDYRLLLELINELNASGAEAISINEQRMVNNTEIRLAGTQMNVNMIPINTPYVFKVLGDPDTLDGAISQRFGVIQSIRENGYYVEVRKVDQMDILPYTGMIRFRFSEIMEP